MAEEPNKPIEEALKAYAEQRRRESPRLELHEADRRMLLAEAARLGPARPPERVGWFFRWWPQITFGTALVAVVAGLAWLLGPGAKEEFNLAKADHGSAPAAAESSMRADQPAPMDSLEVKLREPTAPTTPPAEPEQAGAPEPATQPAPQRPAAAPVIGPAKPSARLVLGEKNKTEVKDKASLDRAAAEAVSGERGRIASAPSPVTAPAAPRPEGNATALKSLEKPAALQTESLAARRSNSPTADSTPTTDEKKADKYGVAKLMPRQQNAEALQQLAAITQAQRFAQARGVVRLRNQVTPGTVMQNFELQQSGEQIRIVDADGSVYAGRLAGTQTGLANNQATAFYAFNNLVTNQQTPGTNPVLQNQPSMNNVAAANQLGLNFQAIGTNRSLNQRVEFNGTWFVGNEVQANVRQQQPATRTVQAGNKAAARTMIQNQVGGPGQAGNSLEQRVQGQILIGTNSEAWLDAVPTER